MASPTEIRKGRAILFQGTPHIVLECNTHPGRQAGFVQTTLRNLQSGSTTTTKFRSTDNVEFLHTTTQKLEYSYKDGDGFHFMDLETYEDTILGPEMVGEDEIFLVEGNNYDILLVDDQAVRLELPSSVEATVTEAPDALQGDTAGNVLKPVTISSGITVQVPFLSKRMMLLKSARMTGHISAEYSFNTYHFFFLNKKASLFAREAFLFGFVKVLTSENQATRSTTSGIDSGV